MEIKFIDESLVPKKGRGDTMIRNIEPLLVALVSHPNKWAVYPDPVKNYTVVYLRKKFPKYQFAHTDKTQTLYVKYTQDETDLA